MHLPTCLRRPVVTALGLLAPFATAPAAPAADPGAAPAQAVHVAAEAAASARTYPTAIARSFTFNYLMQRGGLRGSCELSWARTGGKYEARLKGTVAGFTVLDWASSGGFDAAGVAPSLYVEHRLGKSDRDVRFRKAESRIVFSGTRSSDIPFVAGVQDRVSWLVQLPAILAADPAKGRAGTRVALYVVGTRGRAGDWVFQSEGRETIKTPMGTLHTVKWTRQAGKGDDLEAEVWLDVERHYLPVRIRLTLAGSEAALDMTLADASP
ncbi:DUF3108 domain-containing protein [Ramlibacter alkalitolerans]|uniref:DUF3108 domain-containing protein n=1 Tax=Ramlibacter alkalitolerans TaxID=2039631 RepID=A0ABS1JWD6_9BURK|nr:DUF3108 domain-containing protein [Ramlibacter alkalitolerans]MBL0428512.1 DUF3108 domain-containing protein [Ramlibacter alkalitolerans]